MRYLLLLILVLGALGSRAAEGNAASDPEYVYCVNNARAERTSCNADYLEDKSKCQDQYAFDIWIERPEADDDLYRCYDDALADRLWCRSLIDPCVPQ